MTEQEFYYTIEKNAIAEYKDKGSKFIAYVFPIKDVEDFKDRMNELKKEHPKATHHCFAYRLGLDGNNFRVSDAGEPSGTAGKPILGQIDSKQLTNTLVVVVRYFGGTLLGVPGLINAYKTATALVLQVAPIVQKTVEVQYKIDFDYTRMNDVMTIIKQTGCSIIKQEVQLFCHFIIGIPKTKLREVVYRLEDMRNVEIKKV